MSYEKAKISRPGQRLALCCLSFVLMGCSSSEAIADPQSETMLPTESVPAELASPELAPTDSSAAPGSRVSFGGANSAQILPVGATTVLGGETIELELTRTPQEQAKGLMFRQKLPDNRGMVFNFDPPRLTRFWMKNVVIDLDMIFLHEGSIVEIAAEVPPCTADPCPTYGPAGKLVDTVIELRGGRAAELGLQAGDRVVIEAIADSNAPSSQPPSEFPNPQEAP